MIARGGIGIDELALHSFQLVARLLLELPQSRRQNDNLKDLEFLGLLILQQHQPMIVGDIQRILGILPAQMSRVIRSLEARPAPLVDCQINQQDKRKIDVQLTPAGEQALGEYIGPRVETITDLLRELTDEERDSLAHLLNRLETLRSNRSEA